MGALLLLLGGAAAAGAVLAGLGLFTARTARRVERTLPPEGRFVDVGGARLHYLDTGPPSGEGGEGRPPLLLLHGLGGHARNFTHSLVGRLAGDFRVVVMERPGSGHSTRAPGAGANLRAQAAAVAAFAEALGLERPVLVGHSLGGAVALAVALEHPGLAAGLALVAPLTHVEGGPPPVFRPLLIASPRVRRLVAWTVATPGAILRRRAALGAIFGPDPVPPDYATVGGGMLGLRPQAFESASTDLVAVNHDLPGMVARYPELRLPVGVLFGTEDGILDHRRHGAALAERVPGAVLELVPGGHMLPLTAPDAVAAFVRRVAAAAAARPPAEPAEPIGVG